jgi:hypothetical protein
VNQIDVIHHLTQCVASGNTLPGQVVLGKDVKIFFTVLQTTTFRIADPRNCHAR